jgi:23S rRNA pseudouridine1911/1915/1917 synthase
VQSIISTDPSRSATALDANALLATDLADAGGELDDAGDPSEHGHELRTFDVPVHLHGQRLDRVLVELVQEFSRSYLQQLTDDGAVLINGKVATKSAAKLKVADVVSITLRPTPQSLAFKPEQMHLDIVFQDEHLLIVNKRAGVVVHPAAGNWSGTLLNGLLAHDKQCAELPRAGIVHRLDKDTSGLMVVARTRLCMDALVALIAARDVSRQYIAIGHRAWPGEVHRRVDAAIGRDIKNRLRMAVVDLSRGSGKEAMTDFELLSNSKQTIEHLRRKTALNSSKNDVNDMAEVASAKASKVASNQSNIDDRSYCLLRCRLHTGRTHQIRVHAAHIAHPLVGDAVYGGAPAAGLERQALHAERLAFVHPMTGEEMSFVAPLPEDLLRTCEALGLDFS